MAPHHPLTWYEAEDYCIKYQAHLVSVGGSKESDSVRALADQHNPQFLTWIGLSRDRNTTEAPFFWSDGREVNFTSFREGEPTDFGNCVALSSSSEADSWMTIDCDYSQFFLCKRPAHGFQPIILTSSSGEFQSPGYPTAYSDDISVNYFIELRPEQRVLVTVEHIETEESHDFLEIFDGSGGGGVTLAKLSGMHRNRSFLSDSNTVTASFTSDDSGAGVGFRALYSSWKEAPIEHLPERGGVVHSIGYPNFAPSFTLQRFLIQCSIEEDIHLNVSDLECSLDDRLTFYKGPSSEHPVLRESCDFDKQQYIRCESESVYVVFETSDTFALSRWRLRYDCVRKDGFGDEVVIP